MLCKLLGRKKYSGEYQGKAYSGVKFFLAHEDEHAEGVVVDIEKIQTANPNYNKVMTIPIGSEVSPIYNRFGNIDDISVIK